MMIRTFFIKRDQPKFVPCPTFISYRCQTTT